MKKILTKLLVLALSVVLLCGTLTGCKDEKWNGTSLTNPGNVKSVYSFVAESDNYTYFINGLGSSTDDNTFGKPVKGALAATDGSKTEIVVPKLFVATDYDAGLFIDGGYVYYGTPNTEKNASGEIASDELVFTRTKLDGSATETFFSIKGLSTAHRFVKSGDTVYIVYYDVDETAIKEYNTTTKDVKTIVKTDAKTSGMESLENYIFLTDVEEDSTVAIFTTVVYSEVYSESKENDSENYQRATENYNKVYAYKAGNEPELIFNGAFGDTPVDDTTFALTKVKDGYVYYTKKVIHEASATTYVASIVDFANKTEGAKVVNESYISDNGLVVDPENVYFVENNKLMKSTLVAKDGQIKTVVALVSTINKMLFMDGDYLYYINTSNFLARVNVKIEDAVEERVSEGTVATTWYAPEKVTLGGKTCVAYLDNSSTGASYVKTVQIDVAWNEDNFVDTDKDGEFDEGETKFLDGQNFLAKITDADKGSIMNAKVVALSNDFKNGAIQFEEKEENGKTVLTFDKFNEVKAEYDKLPDAVKENVSDDSKTKLSTYEKAIKLANLYVQLEDVIKYNDLTPDLQTALEGVYEGVKGQIEELKSTEVDAVIETNLKYYYQLANELFKK